MKHRAARPRRSRPALPRLWRGGRAGRRPVGLLDPGGRPGISHLLAICASPEPVSVSGSVKRYDLDIRTALKHPTEQGKMAGPDHRDHQGGAVNLTVARMLPIASASLARVRIPMDRGQRSERSWTTRWTGLKRPPLKLLHFSGDDERDCRQAQLPHLRKKYVSLSTR